MAQCRSVASHWPSSARYVMLVGERRKELGIEEISYVKGEQVMETVQIEREKIVQTLRQAGMIMASEEQRASAEAMMAALCVEETPSRNEVEASLARLKVPLSAEIIAMRGER